MQNLGLCCAIVGIHSKRNFTLLFTLLLTSAIALYVPNAHLNVIRSHCSSIRGINYPLQSNLKSVISDIPKADIEKRCKRPAVQHFHHP